MSDEKNKRSAENLLQAISDVWNNKVPTPWAVGAMQDSGEYEELAKSIADRWEQNFAEFNKDQAAVKPLKNPLSRITKA